MSAVLQELDVDCRTGLDQQEVSQRLAKFGSNELRTAQAISPLRLLLRQFRSVLIILLLVAAALSAVVGEAVDAVVIAAIVLFSALLGFIQEFRAERAIEALQEMLAPTARVLRNSEAGQINAKDLVPGDIVTLEAGDLVPADLRLIETHSLHCSAAALTGESTPVAIETEILPANIPLAERNNSLFAGTTITYGRGTGVVTETGARTQFGRIAEQVAAVEDARSPLEKRTTEIGRWLAVLSLSVCILVVAISLLRAALTQTLDTGLALDMSIFAIALAVAAVPEALPAIVTGALALGMYAMGKQNALVKRMPAVETLGSATVICCDKTGTLTRGEMTVRRILSALRELTVTGTGFEAAGHIEFPDDVQADDRMLGLLLQGGALCNDAEIARTGETWSIRGDPTEGALLVLAEKAGIIVEDIRTAWPRMAEVPFSSERKRMTTLHQGSGKTLAFMKGAPEVVLERCSRIADSNQIRDLSESDRRRILEENEGMAADALRILAVAYREPGDRAATKTAALESEMVFLGLVGLMDPPRDTARDAVRISSDVGIRTVMITGDNEITAKAVATELGIHREDDLVVPGTDLAAMSEQELEAIVERVSVYARVSPLDKLKIVRAWQARGQVVAMTGDGVNDAPALKQADIGVAMGITGTDVAKEAADMVLADDNFETIVSAIRQGRSIYDNIKKYLAYLLQANIAEVIVIGGIVLILGPASIPLLPAAILYINLATDGLPALALGVAPPDPDVMQRPPRPPGQSVFDWDVKSFILRAALLEVPVFYWIFMSRADDIEYARSMLFFMFVAVELVIALNCRSLRFSIFSVPPHRWLLLALAWEVVLLVLIVQLPAAREAFGIVIPNTADLLLIAAMGLLVMGVIEAVKLALRRGR